MTTKEKLIKSALKLFAKKGIDKTSTREITSAVGLAEGTLYRHFKSKQELIDSTYLEIKKDIFVGVEDRIDPEESVEKNVKHIARHIITYFLKNYDAMIFMDAMERDPKFSPGINKELEEILKPANSIIIKWIKDGELKNVDTELITSVYWDLIIRITRYCESKKIKKVKDSYVDIIWEVIKR